MKLVKRLKEICSDKKEAAYCAALLFIMLFGLGFWLNYLLWFFKNSS